MSLSLIHLACSRRSLKACKQVRSGVSIPDTGHIGSCIRLLLLASVLRKGEPGASLPVSHHTVHTITSQPSPPGLRPDPSQRSTHPSFSKILQPSQWVPLRSRSIPPPRGGQTCTVRADPPLFPYFSLLPCFPCLLFPSFRSQFLSVPFQDGCRGLFRHDLL